MNKVILKKIGLGFLYVLLTVYVLFLILPIIVNPFLAKYTEEISKFAEESCGLKIKIEKLKLVTTPKLTAGIKIGHLSAALPDGEEFLSVDNAQAKLSLLPLITKRIEADMFSVENIDAILNVKPDGNLQIIDYLPETEEDTNKEQLTSLPMGLKLSNRLPNVYVKEYMFTMVDMRDKREYTLQGGNLKITDFILNKGIKVSTAGIAKLDGEQQFSYNLKINNKIMPNIDINDLIFAQNNSNSQPIEKKTPETPITFNIIDIFKGIKQNGLTADAKVDVTTFKKSNNINIKGLMDVENISLLVDNKRLPNGHIKLDFKGEKSFADIVLYSAPEEISSIFGTLENGRKNKIDLSFKSNAEINNIFKIINSIAQSFNYKDLGTLSATGKIDADFNVKSDMKQVSSNGYFRIPSASVNYALYNIFIDKINSDIDFNNNNIDIKNIGFTILSQPLKIYGTISDKAQSDIHMTADKLFIKGLLAATGQVGILKDNDIKSGTLSLDASVKGDLKELQPTVNVLLNNIDILNKPSSTGLKLSEININLLTENKKYKGEVKVDNINVNNPAAKFLVPKIYVMLDNQDINISDTYLLLNNSKIDISGKITDYTNKDMFINIKAKGNLIANDILKMLPPETHSMISAKGALPVLAVINGNDKAQNIDIQLLATPSNYLHIADLNSIKGKGLLVNSQINISGNSLNLENTGAFVSNKTSLSDLPKSNLGGTPIVKVSGGISDIANLTIKNLNIATAETQTISIPTFNNSKASVAANITLNGNALTPMIKGNIHGSNISIPTMQTNIKNVAVDFGNLININVPDISIADSKMNVKAAVSPNFTNGIIIKNVDFNSSYINADTLATAAAGASSGAAVSTGNSQQPADLGIIIQSGKANIAKFQTGKIIATNLTSDFNLKNNVFTLKNLAGNAFEGKILGNISVNVIKGATKVDMNGKGMNAVNAIDAAAGIPNALSGTLGFNANMTLNAFASDFNAMMKSIKGSASFDIKDGTYMNIGTIDQLVFANNIVSNAVLKAAVSKIKTLPVIKNSSKFDTITGNIKLNNGIATLAPVKSSGTSIAYYVTGQYNLINGYTNVNILGRMGADLVVALGPLGDLSVSKITSYLPKFGANTLNLLSALTSNPAAENVSQIPKLSGNQNNYKDFKVVFNGNVTSPASIKSFKWLSTCDTSAVTSGTAVHQIKNEIKETKQNIQNDIEAAKKRAEEAKANAKAIKEDAKTQFNNAKNQFNDIKNMFKKPSSTQTPSNVPETQTNTGN